MFKDWKSDLPASIVVFFVAVPLCLGIALASGAPMYAGIIAGMVGGIVVGMISGSHTGVSGPAAGLAVIVFASIAQLGSFETFLLAVVIAGVFQLVMGFAKAGIVGYYFPSSVIKGMLTAIGIIIIMKQIPHALGYDADYEGDMDFIQKDNQNTFSEILNSLNHLTAAPIIISIVSMTILLLWENVLAKRSKFFQLVQGPLVAVVASILLHLFFVNFTTDFSFKATQLVQVPISEGVMSFFGNFTLPDFSQLYNQEVYIVAITIAVVASLETLLCVEATDKIDPYKRITPTNLELKAQGIGNILSGLIGGLPITQVIVRSSANIQSGNKTKLSAILHGLLLLFSIIAIPRLLNLIPLATLATILFIVGYKLAKPTLFKSMYKAGWDQFIPFIVTILAIIFTDLLKGVIIGFGVGVFYLLRTNFRNSFYFTKEENTQKHTVKIKLAEQVSFLNKANIMDVLKRIPNDTHVILDASHSFHVDYDVKEIIDNFKVNATTRNISVETKGLLINNN